MSKYKKMKVDLLSAHKVKYQRIILKSEALARILKARKLIPVIDEAIFCSGKI